MCDHKKKSLLVILDSKAHDVFPFAHGVLVFHLVFWACIFMLLSVSTSFGLEIMHFFRKVVMLLGFYV
jgi:hypothetical protein